MTTTGIHRPTVHLASARPTRSRTAGTVVAACIAVFAAYLPITSVAVALPTIQHDLHSSTSDLTWVLDAFVVGMAAFVLTGGALGDRYGRKPVLLIGLAALSAGDLLAALSGPIGVLWAGQAVAGVGAAIALPTTLAMVSGAVRDPHRRAAAIGAWASSLSLGLVAGPWLTTLVVDAADASWQWIFAAIAAWTVVVLAIVAAIANDSRAADRVGLDLIGQLPAVVLVVAAVFAVITAADDGWTSATVLIALTIAAASLVCFVWVELRVRTPMLDLRLFRSPAFSGTSVVATLMMFALVGSVFILSLFFGTVQRLSLPDIALRFLAPTASIVVVGPGAAQLAHRLGRRTVMTVGLLTAGSGLLTLTSIDPASGLGSVVWRLIVIGGGFGLVLAPMTAAAVDSVEPRFAGVASAATNAFRQLGAALGPAVLGAVLTSCGTSAFPGALRALHVTEPDLSRLDRLVGQHGLQAVGALPHSATTARAAAAAGDAFSSAMHTAVVVGGVTMYAAALVAFVLVGRRPQAATTFGRHAG